MGLQSNFLDKEKGYGTEYEITIFKEIAKNLVQKYQIKSCLEYPQNNLLGGEKIFPFSKQEKHPDLVWNFCEFEKQKNSRLFLEKLSQKTNRYLLVVTQNFLNPGVFLHFLFHRFTGRTWGHGDLKKMNYRSVLKVINQKKDLQMVEIGAFDLPWFILDVYETGRFFRTFPFFKDKIKSVKKSRFERMPLVFRLWLGHHHFLLIKKIS